MKSSRTLMSCVAVCALIAALAGCGTRQSRNDVAAAAGGSLATGNGGSSASGVAGTGTAGAGGTSSGAVSGQPVAGGTSAGPATGTGGGGDAASDPESTAAPGDVAAGGAAAANGAPIVIGNVSTTRGVGADAQLPGQRGLQAWVARTNANGGINGHPIELVVAEDGGDPARHAAAVQDLVENAGVVAFVSNWAATTVQASIPYLEAHRIPVIGGDSSSNVWFDSAMLFPQGPTPDDFMRARLAALAELTDGRSIATIVCREAAVCAEGAAAVKRYAAEFGFQVVYEGQASIAQPDFTAECISARNAGADIILPVFDASSMRRIAQSCDRQAYRPTYDLASAYDPNFADVPAFEGAVISHPTFPPHADAPAAQEFRDALEQYAPDQAPVPVAGSGWAAGVMFGEIASVAFPADATPSTQALLDALWTVQNNTFGGLTGPLTYQRDQPSRATAPRCMFTEQIRDGQFVATKGMEPTCV